MIGYTKNNKKISSMSKSELIIYNRGLKGNLGLSMRAVTIRTNQIRHFRKRLKKIRDSLDYLLQHPFSIDESMQTKKHSRDKGVLRTSRGK